MPSKTEQENMCPKALSVRKASETFGSVGTWSYETDTKGAEGSVLSVSAGLESLCPCSLLSCHAAILGCCFALFLCWASLLLEGTVHAVSRGAAWLQVHTCTHRHLRLLENVFAENHCSQGNTLPWIMGSHDPVLHGHSYLTSSMSS